MSLNVSVHLIEQAKAGQVNEADFVASIRESVDRKLLSVNARMRVWGDVLGTGSSDRLP
jgi:hypothetical protein